MNPPQKQTVIDYPFGNPQGEKQQDTQSYHSVINDNNKFKYFNEDNQSQESFAKRASQSSIMRKKNPLPPVYPYEEMKKLKQSMRLQNKESNLQTDGFDSKSIRSMDSFHTANQFQSICYQEGDYEKIVGQMDLNQDEQIKNVDVKINPYGSVEKQLILDSPDVRGEQCDTKSYQRGININMQQSNALDEAQLQQLQGSILSDSCKYQRLQQRIDYNLCVSQKEIKKAQENNIISEKINEDEQSVQISRIQKIMNNSLQYDQQIYQLTNQLQLAQAEQQELLRENKAISQQKQFLQRYQSLQSRYSFIQNRLMQLKCTHQYFTKQLSTISQMFKSTENNNIYLKKQVQFFREKLINYKGKQDELNKKQNQLNEKVKLLGKKYQQLNYQQKQLYKKQQQQLNQSQLNTSTISKKEPQNKSCTIGKKLKHKTYHISPKAPKNQSQQSKKYKQLTFQYCSRQQLQQEGMIVQSKSQQKWLELQIDRQNSPPEYKIVYSFQQRNTLLVVRVVDALMGQLKSQQSQGIAKKDIINLNNNKQFSSASSSSSWTASKKNYQYMVRFMQSNSESKEQKLQSLTKQLIVHLNQDGYQLKSFTKKIQLYLIISEQDVYVDLIKVIPLPNPIVFYIQNRFTKLNKAKCDSNLINKIKKEDMVIYRNLNNLYKLMRTYVINIQQMVDIQSVRKLIQLKWVNTNADIQPKYFSIKSISNQKLPQYEAEKNQQNQQTVTKNQLFYVKIESCILNNKKQKQYQQQKKSLQKESQNSNNNQSQQQRQLRYSLVFQVASNIDNGLLIDVIEFLTFLTVI